MAKYETERYALAAQAFVKAHRKADPAVQGTEDATKASARALADTLGEKHPAYAGLDAVARLRPSIARRFIRLSVAPLQAAPVRLPRKAKVAA